MIAPNGRLSPVEREALRILVTEGYRVVPMRSCFVSRYKPVNLMGMKGADEMIYLKLKNIARIPDDPGALEEFCRDDCQTIRTLFPVETGYIRLHRELWVRPRAGSFCCFEVLPDGMRVVTRGRIQTSTHGQSGRG